MLDVWLKQVFKTPVRYEALAGDAGHRHYYRVYHKTKTYIVMHMTVDKSWHSFIKVADYFGSAGLNIPKRLYVDPKSELMLLSDLGDTLYLDGLTTSSVDRLYQEALQALITIQKLTPIMRTVLPTLNASYLHTQLNVLHNWCVDKLLTQTPSQEHEQAFRCAYQDLIQDILTHRYTVTHFDFHSRNLLVTPQKQPGIIDFQDALLGPLTYDLVSLLQDCYINWPFAKLEQWVLYYQQHHPDLRHMSPQNIFQDMLRVGLQRHLKNLGVFARLYLRDQKPAYLQYLPRVLENIILNCTYLNEYRAITDFCTRYIIEPLHNQIASFPISVCQKQAMTRYMQSL